MANPTWWQRAVFYQIYPRSFADGNGDGIGDFPGMTARLDYLRDLGITAVWLSPHYPSPFVDCGYDISDYTDVGPEYGTLADFTTFLGEAHARGIRVILDLVLNHSSDQHPWFRASRARRDDPKRDWYIWRDGRDGGPPNNWVSIFGGSAWEYDATTDQYYYHAFLKEQPDLNWRNPQVKAAMWDAVRFWLDLGVDGFRLDAIATIFEDPDLTEPTLTRPPDVLFRQMATAATDAEHEEAFREYLRLLRYQKNQPGLHELMRELRALIDTYDGDRVLVGEDDSVAFHGTGNDELHLVFNFPLMRAARLTPAVVRANQRMRLAELPHGAWPCNTLGNHDNPRVWDRFGDGTHDAALARLHIALLLTMRGTPFLYNGEEIGMRNLTLDDLGQIRDMAAIRHYRLLTEEIGMPPAEAAASVLGSTRDRCRSPLQWQNAPNGGFSPPEVAPWLPVSADFAIGVNVADQGDDSSSLLSFYRALLHARQSSAVLMLGDYQPVHEASDDHLAFIRHDAASGESALVVLSFAAVPQRVPLDLAQPVGALLFAHGVRESTPDHLTLDPFGVAIVALG